MVEIPGISLSLIRSATSVQAGSPLLVSGRFTLFGLGAPAFIRVFLIGPSYNPETTHFDATAQPFSGEYNVQVTPAKDGEYSLYAQAYPLPVLPSGPLVPEGILALPAIGSTDRLPIVVGTPTAGGVTAQTPSGSQFLSSPNLTPVEVSVGAPSVSVSTGGGVSGTIPAITLIAPTTPYVPPAPVTPSPVTPISAPTTQVSFPATPTSSMLGTPTFGMPSQLTYGEIWTGNITIPTVIPSAIPGASSLPAGSSLIPSYSYRYNLYLEDPETGADISVASGFSSARLGDALNLPISYPTSRLNLSPTQLPRRYNAILQVMDQNGNAFFNQIVGRLYILAATGLPEVPKPAITVPSLPSLAMIQTPTATLPSEIDLGKVVSGNIVIPTVWPASLPTPPTLPTYNLSITPELKGPSGTIYQQQLPVTRSFQPGQSISLPVSFDTGKLEGPGTYDILLLVRDSAGNLLTSAKIAALRVMAVAPPVGPSPAIPASLTVLNSPRQGEALRYSFSGFQPNAPVKVYVQGGGGVTNTADATGSGSFSFIDNDPPGRYTLIAEDSFGHRATATFTVVAPSLGPSNISSVSVQLGYTELPVGQSLAVPVSYKHSGKGETALLYAAIGNVGTFGFDEILVGRSRLNVPDDPVPADHNASVLIPITGQLAAGRSYAVYAKITERSSGGPEVVSAPVQNIFKIAVTISPAGEPTLQVTNVPKTGGPLNFKWSGFQPNAPVTVRVSGGGGATYTSNSSGAGSGAFASISEAPGNYLLVAEDSYGHQAMTLFTVI